jgi:hypothetical protein
MAPFKKNLLYLDITMKLFQIRVSLVIESILDPGFYFKRRVVYVKQQNSYFKNTSQKLQSHNGLNWIGGVMFNVLASSTVYRGFEHRSDQKL